LLQPSTIAASSKEGETELKNGSRSQIIYGKLKLVYARIKAICVSVNDKRSNRINIGTERAICGTILETRKE
jgi:hypothetical protein